MAKPTRDDAMLILRALDHAALSGTPAPIHFTSGPDFNSDYKEFISKHPPGSEAYGKAILIATHYEGLGTMWKHGLINEDLLFDWLAVHMVWERMEGFVLGSRAAAGEPRLGENFEAMAKASAAWGKGRAPRRAAAPRRPAAVRGRPAARSKQTRSAARR